jgi:CRISPR-associated protein Cmr2
VIVFDADDMGKKLSACDSIEKHKELSRKLSEYAEWAREYVDKGRGKTIYAGGDDFMGLLNLTTLFESIEGLRKKFGEQFQAEQLTFSAGIAIAHYKAPLGEVLSYARKMEHKAKEQDKKNAFGVAVMKHSGEIHETVLPWQNYLASSLRERDWNTSYLTNTYTMLQQGISPSFINNLNETLSVWDNQADSFIKQSEYEIKRCINRSSNGVVVDKLIDSVTQLYKQVAVKNSSNTHFINALNIVDFINRKLQ